MKGRKNLGVAPLCAPLRVKRGRAKAIKPPAVPAVDPRQLSLFTVTEVGGGKKTK